MLTVAPPRALSFACVACVQDSFGTPLAESEIDTLVRPAPRPHALLAHALMLVAWSCDQKTVCQELEDQGRGRRDLDFGLGGHDGQAHCVDRRRHPAGAEPVQVRGVARMAPRGSERLTRFDVRVGSGAAASRCPRTARAHSCSWRSRPWTT